MCRHIYENGRVKMGHGAAENMKTMELQATLNRNR